MVKASFIMSTIARLGLPRVALTLMSPFVLFGCSGSDVRDLTGLRDERSLQSESTGKNDLVTVSSLFVPKIVVQPQVQADAVEVAGFYDKIITEFSVETGMSVISDDKVKAPNYGTSPDFSVLNQRALQAGADALLITTVTNFSEKSGSALGTTRAALLAAQFSIIRLKDSKEIWSSNYFSTEQPNTYNLLEVKRRIQRDRGIELPDFSVLAQEAAKRAALDFAGRRTAQFVKR